jgi:hypothetical protein
MRVAAPQVDAIPKRWVSRPGLFQDEAGNIGSQLIAITLSQQQDCVHRSAEKAAPHHRKDTLAHRGVGDAFIERVKPSFSEQIEPVACPSCRSPGEILPASPSSRRPIGPLLDAACFAAIIHKYQDFCQ